MLRNPVQLRLEKCVSWQHLTFMAALCERMYPNYALFCKETQFADAYQYRIILDAVWEVLTVKTAKINFDRQLERLEEMVPSEADFDMYLVYPAIDACHALADLLHGLLDKDMIPEFCQKISAISVKTVADLEFAQTGVEVTDENQKENEAVCQEWDVQWDIYRAFKDEESRNVEMIKELRYELRADCVSNIGIEL